MGDNHIMKRKKLFCLFLFVISFTSYNCKNKYDYITKIQVMAENGKYEEIIDDYLLNDKNFSKYNSGMLISAIAHINPVFTLPIIQEKLNSNQISIDKKERIIFLLRDSRNSPYPNF